jgi:hypothetical protein
MGRVKQLPREAREWMGDNQSLDENGNPIPATPEELCKPDVLKALARLDKLTSQQNDV